MFLPCCWRCPAFLKNILKFAWSLSATLYDYSSLQEHLSPCRKSSDRQFDTGIRHQMRALADVSECHQHISIVCLQWNTSSGVKTGVVTLSQSRQVPEAVSENPSLAPQSDEVSSIIPGGLT